LVSKKSAKIIGNLAKKIIQQTMIAREKMVNSIPKEPQAILPEGDVAMNDEEIKVDIMEEDLSNYVTVDGIIIK